MKEEMYEQDKKISLQKLKLTKSYFLLMSILQFTYFIYMNVFIFTSKLYPVVPLLGSFYILSIMTKFLIWKIISRITVGLITITKMTYLRIFLLLDFKEAYKFDRSNSFKENWMLIYNVPCLVGSPFLFLLLNNESSEIVSSNITDNQDTKQLIVFVTAFYVLLGLTFCNYIFIYFFSMNQKQPIFLFRKIMLIIYIFSSMFSYFYLLAQNMDSIIVFCSFLLFRLISTFVFTYYVSNNVTYSHLRIKQLLPQAQQHIYVTLVRNILRMYMIYCQTVDAFPLTIKISNIYDRITSSTPFIIYKIINTIEILALIIYGFSNNTLSISDNFFQVFATSLIGIYLLINGLYFFFQALFKIKHSFPSVQIDHLFDIDQVQEQQEISINNTTSLLPQEQDQELYVLNAIPQTKSKLLIQLELKTKQIQLFEERNVKKLSYILQTAFENKYIKNLILIVEEQLIIDINRNQCILYLENKNIDYISNSFLKSQSLSNKYLILVFKEELTQKNEIQLQKSIINHYYDIDKIRFNSHIYMKNFQEKFFESLNHFFQQHIIDMLQIQAFFKNLAEYQIYNPNHILFELHDTY